MNSILVIVPTRGRRKQCERLLESFEKTTDNADMVFVTDGDDRETYLGMDWGSALHAELEPREYLSGKLNKTADSMVDAYDALMFVGDDHEFQTEHWDTIFSEKLDSMGGTGILYPDDKRRKDVPEIWLMTSDIVRELGWLASPTQQHYYLDNIIGELGKRSGLIRWVPEVVIEHLHYSVNQSVERDETYVSTEEKFGTIDAQSYAHWRAVIMPHQISRLRRQFNPDIKWVLGRI